jgi:hypothetical protein
MPMLALISMLTRKPPRFWTRHYVVVQFPIKRSEVQQTRPRRVHVEPWLGRIVEKQSPSKALTQAIKKY